MGHTAPVIGGFHHQPRAVGQGHRSLRGSEITGKDHRIPPSDYTSAVCPPSTYNTEPVINDASSEARNKAALAISSGKPRRPMGNVLAKASSCSGVMALRNIGVSVGPGQITLTRTPCFAWSIAMARLSMWTPPFEVT